MTPVQIVFWVVLVIAGIATLKMVTSTIAKRLYDAALRAHRAGDTTRSARLQRHGRAWHGIAVWPKHPDD